MYDMLGAYSKDGEDGYITYQGRQKAGTNDLAIIKWTEGNLADRVKKSGDTMTGHLKITRPNATPQDYLFSVSAPHMPANKQIAFSDRRRGR